MLTTVVGYAQGLAVLIAVQRLWELSVARRNTRRLLSSGGIEHGAAHYPVIVLLHAAWIAYLILAIDPNVTPNWSLIVGFAVLQGARVWIIRTLGPHWTTRVISTPGAPVVTRGPYRLMRHPNYFVVQLEIMLVPAAFGDYSAAIAFGGVNALILFHRIRVEEAALAERRAT